MNENAKWKLRNMNPLLLCAVVVLMFAAMGVAWSGTPRDTARRAADARLRAVKRMKRVAQEDRNDSGAWQRMAGY